MGGRLGQAYLFSGPRGCGKTTAARILAKVVNCEKPSDGEPCCACDSCKAVASGEHLDVMEIDGASNRGIDQIRELKSHVGLTSFMGGSKVYILDEVHMLTMEAFNALLKTLEEPPPSVLFIFATTEPNKVPVTIRSRCQHVPFHRISTSSIAEQLKNVASQESVPVEEAALWEIARNADGALRDALSLAEQAIALGNGTLSLAAVRGLFGGGSRAELEGFVSLLKSSPKDASALLKELLGKGASPERFLDALFTLFRDMWVYSLWSEDSFSGLSLSEEEKKFVRDETPRWLVDELKGSVSVCASLYPKTKQGLRSDVFSGLLLFDLMRELGARGGEKPLLVAREDAGTRSAERKPYAGESPAEVKLTTETEKNEKKRPCAPNSPGTPVERIARTASEFDFEGMFASLWESDLALCAALLDARLLVVGGELVIDCSEAGSLARTMLEFPRSKIAIEKAFGVGGAEAPKSVSVSAETSSGEAPERRKPGAGMSIEELSSYLGAELLMSKPASRDGLPVSDEEHNGVDIL
jgi:DNA polymerase-3 subunit gamma/tau